MQKTEIKAVDMVRQIRDRHYEQLKDKSRDELLEFYRREAAAANAEAEEALRSRTAARLNRR